MIRQPSSVIAAGLSGSGKSELVEQWLRYLNVFHVQVRPHVKKRWDPISSWITGPWSFDQMVWRHPRTGPGVDDLMEEGGQDKRVLDLLTKDSHHRNITVLYLTKDLLPPGKFSKTINRNVH